MPGVVIVDDSGLCCCGPAFNVMCDVNCSSAIISHCLLILLLQESIPPPPTYQPLTKGFEFEFHSVYVLVLLLSQHRMIQIRKINNKII